jgi:hypothetical protein
MGRKALPATAAVLHQIDAWCILDKLEEALPLSLRPLAWAAKHELQEANRILEGIPERDANP